VTRALPTAVNQYPLEIEGVSVPTVKFEVTSKARAYWIAVDDKDVRLVNGKGAANLKAGDHILTWWMIGRGGDTMTIIGTTPGKEVVKVTSKIPIGEGSHANAKKFTV
jgi:hypothetical protein